MNQFDVAGLPDDTTILDVNNPVDLFLYTAAPDGIFDYYFISPDPLTMFAFYGYRAGISQGDGWWISAYDVGNVVLFSQVSAVQTVRIFTAPGVIAPGRSYIFRAIVKGDLHRLFLWDGLTWAQIGTDVNVSVPELNSSFVVSNKSTTAYNIYRLSASRNPV